MISVNHERIISSLKSVPQLFQGQLDSLELMSPGNRCHSCVQQQFSGEGHRMEFGPLSKMQDGLYYPQMHALPRRMAWQGQGVQE